MNMFGKIKTLISPVKVTIAQINTFGKNYGLIIGQEIEVFKIGPKDAVDCYGHCHIAKTTEGDYIYMFYDEYVLGKKVESFRHIKKLLKNIFNIYN